MKVVKVHGVLEEKLGQSSFEFDVNTPAEAIRALTANFSGLDKWIVDSEQDGIAYKVLIGKTVIGEENFSDLGLPFSDRETFEIVPVIGGAGSGFKQFLIGAALIGASFLFPGAGMFGSGAGIIGKGATGFALKAWTAAGTLLSGIGANMLLGGVAEMINPTQQPDFKEVQRSKDYTFSGITNTAQQGVAVPIVYGRAFVGSAVISSGLDVDQLL
tara:strand:+ start:1158 stop:1802 length:645 start_codon:yes stop_codon:yes gene_type:complete